MSPSEANAAERVAGYLGINRTAHVDNSPFV